ncbi:AcrR family transcriptional regulator [Bradyrhizobium sp. GM24.11]
MNANPDKPDRISPSLAGKPPAFNAPGSMPAKAIANDDPPETANRNDRRRQRTRETILAAAEQVFRGKGIDTTTVNDVTEAADVAYGSFYNHFKSMEEVVSALVEASLRRVADRTASILDKAERVELLPCVGARVVMRTLWQDPAIRWMLGRPYIFVEEFYKVGTPFMLRFEREAVEAGVLKPAGGHDCWLKTYPWILIGELTALAETGNILEHEKRFAEISLRFLGVDDALAPKLIARSRELVLEGGLPEPKRGAAKRAKRATSS